MDYYLDKLEKELLELTKKLAIVSDTVNKIELGEGQSEIQFGSKVLITWGDGRTTEGRVWSVKGNGVYGINRDGYAGTINLGVNRPDLTQHTLKNLSVGTYGKLEREKWLLTEKISNIQKQIEQAIESRIAGIKESFTTGQLDQVIIDRIIGLKEFKDWYSTENNIPDFPSIDTWPKKLRSAIAKEFILKLSSKKVYKLLLKEHI